MYPYNGKVCDEGEIKLLKLGQCGDVSREGKNQLKVPSVGNIWRSYWVLLGPSEYCWIGPTK